MFTHPLLEGLKHLKLSGMADAFVEQLQLAELHTLSFEERFSFLLDRELLVRQNRRLKARLTQAKLKQQACIEHIDFKPGRGLDKKTILSLSSCQWIKAHQNILLFGSTGTGKTFVACALAHKACLEGYSSHYVRLPRFLQELSIAKGDGRYTKIMGQLAKTDVLILDDWGLNKFNDEQRRDLLEILDDRHNIKSTIVTSQLPLKLWHDVIGDTTLADAILDRLVHNAHKLQLLGESLRKQQVQEITKV